MGSSWQGMMRLCGQRPRLVVSHPATSFQVAATSVSTAGRVQGTGWDDVATQRIRAFASEKRRTRIHATRLSILGTARMATCTTRGPERIWTRARRGPSTTSSLPAARCAWCVWLVPGAYMAWGGRDSGAQHLLHSPSQPSIRLPSIPRSASPPPAHRPTSPSSSPSSLPSFSSPCSTLPAGSSPRS